MATIGKEKNGHVGSGRLWPVGTLRFRGKISGWWFFCRVSGLPASYEMVGLEVLWVWNWEFLRTDFKTSIEM